MSENDKAWHLALNRVVAGLYPEVPLPEGVTDKLLALLEKSASQARWRLKGQQLAEKKAGVGK